MQSTNYKLFKNRLFIMNENRLIKVLTEKEMNGQEENQQPYRPLKHE